jgi:hypothetical protein
MKAKKRTAVLFLGPSPRAPSNAWQAFGGWTPGDGRNESGLLATQVII